MQRREFTVRRNSLSRCNPYGAALPSSSVRSRGPQMAIRSVGDLSRREILKISAALAGSGVLLSTGSAGAAQPGGQLTWGVHVSLAPTWFDPAETAATAIPFMVMYALHDAMVKAMPGQPQAPSLAESWTLSEDALAYEFVVRRGAKFHNDAWQPLRSIVRTVRSSSSEVN